MLRFAFPLLLATQVPAHSADPPKPASSGAYVIDLPTPAWFGRSAVSACPNIPRALHFDGKIGAAPEFLPDSLRHQQSLGLSIGSRLVLLLRDISPFA